METGRGKVKTNRILLKQSPKQKDRLTIKSILFDLGNVLLLYDARKSARAFAKALQVPEEKLWEGFFISDFEKAYTRGEISSREFFKRASQYFPNSKMSFSEFSHHWNDIFTESPGMDGLLGALKQHYPLYLISNTNELHYGHIKKTFPVLRHFKKCFPSHQVGHRKPDPKIFYHVLKDIQLKPEETVFVDDITQFVEGARRVGMNAIQFTSIGELKRDLKKLGVSV